MDDPFTSWDIPRGLLYSDNNVKAFVGTVMDTFNPKWFRRGAHRLDPLRHAWSTKVDPYSVLSLCRVGRDIWKLKQRQDPEQNVYLSGLVQRAKTANREFKGMEDYLHELHTAMLFDDAHGAVGELAVPNQDGYDATVRLSRGRTLWISCKRLHISQGEERFARAAVELREAMGAIAARHGHRALEGVVYTQPPLTTIARDRLLDAWNDLCGIYDGQVATQVARDEFFLRIDRSIMLFIPGIDPRTLQSAVAVQFLSGMPVGEHERVRKVIQTAQNQLRASATPTPSKKDAWIVAVHVPRFVSTWHVAELFKKELDGGHFRDIAGVLVMHMQHGGTVGPSPTFTMVEQIALIFNLAGDVPLPDFMEGDPLPILVEGYYAPVEPYYHVGENRFHFDGYVHRDVGPITFQPIGRSITIALPPFIPEIVLAPEELPATDTETQVPLSFTTLETE